jgi:hypothetical protein
MKLLFENWRRYLNEQGGFEMPPGYEEDDYGMEVPPWDDHLHPRHKFYIKEGDKVVFLGDEFNEDEIDLLRNSVKDYINAYVPEAMRDDRLEMYLHAQKASLQTRFRRLKRVPTRDQGPRPVVTGGELQDETGEDEDIHRRGLRTGGWSPQDA